MLFMKGWDVSMETNSLFTTIQQQDTTEQKTTSAISFLHNSP